MKPVSKTGWPPGLLQDDSREFSRWLANKPNSRALVREKVSEMIDVKPTVLFDNNWSGTWYELGRCASVYTFDHPHLGEMHVRTSKVIKVNDDGSFETLNTIYKPKK